MSENEEFIREFLEECAENLDQLDQDLVALESDPHDARRLDSIFRTIHTIKGTSGFFDFSKLGAVAHDGESLLGRLRDGELVLNQDITTALLKLVDAIRSLLADIQDTGQEGARDLQGLSAELIRLALSPGVEPSPSDQADVDVVATPGQEVKPAEPADIEPLADAPPPKQEPRSAEPTATQDAAAQPTLASTAATESHVTGGKAPTPADPEPPSPAAKARPDSAAASEGSIRVDVGLLDDLVDLAGEMVLARNQLNQIGAASEDRALMNSIQKLSLITSELQEGVLQTRMQPIAIIWGKFPRLVRDLAVACEKEVRLEQTGEDTELDRSLLAAIKDPLTHLIRNAVDHGIESPAVRESRGKPRQGRVLLRAYHESGQVHIEITDDGGGIDVQRVKQRAIDRGLITAEQADVISDHELCQLIFRPGFSTAEHVTDVSGRGVGMDVVRTNIEQIGGTVDLQNRPGQGTVMRITIPLTLAIIPALIVTCGGDRFAIPQPGVTELLSYKAEEASQVVEWVHDAPVCRLRGQLLPLVYLENVLKLSQGATAAVTDLNIVVLQIAGCSFGLVVEEVINTEEIVVKPMGRILQSIPVFAGATIMGDGTVALILDVTGLWRQAGLSDAKTDGDRPTAESDHTLLPNESVVLCEVGAGHRIAIPLEDVERLEEFSAAKIEHASGKEVVQYGGKIMPLINVARVLGEPFEESQLPKDLSTVVVGRRSIGSVGLVVSRILDIVACPRGQAIREEKSRPIAESAVIAGRVTDVIDLDTVLQEAGVHPVASAGGAT